MKRILLAAVAATAICGPANAGVEAQALNVFRTICADPNGDFTASVAAADAAGWAPSTETAAPIQGVTITEASTRSKTISGARMVAVMSRGVFRAGQPNQTYVTTCTVFTDKSAFGDLDQRIAQWLAMQPAATEANHVTYRYTVEGATRRAITPPEISAALVGQGVSSVDVRVNGTNAVFALTNFRR